MASMSSDVMEHTLRTMKWAEVVILGHHVASICPLCGAFVEPKVGTRADGSPGVTGIEHHTRWHLAGVH